MHSAGTTALQLPHDRPEYPAAIQRRAGEKVEHRQEPVEHPEIGQHDHPHLGSAGPTHRERPTECSQPYAETGRRTCSSDAELSARPGWVPRQLRHTTEHPQRDALDAHTVAAGDDRVGELVSEQ